MYGYEEDFERHLVMGMGIGRKLEGHRRASVGCRRNIFPELHRNYRAEDMQGAVFAHQIPSGAQHGSPPPNSANSTASTTSDMEVSPSPRIHLTKDSNKLDQSNHSDSGIFTNNYSISSEKSTSTNSENEFHCPICNETAITSQHEFTLHIKSHSSEEKESETPSNNNSYTCKICFKVLSSSSSLDRHILVHTGERPFHCKFCGDTFTTNGNMHRHMRSHSKKHLANNDESSSSSSSDCSETSENNNNNSNSSSKEKEAKKRKLDLADEPNDPKLKKLKCQICERNDFDSPESLEAHFVDNHPDLRYSNKVKCHICHASFPNLKQLSCHQISEHENNNNNNNHLKSHSILGFRDLTFVDFSSEKFPHIARFECEKNLHRNASGTPQKFQCRRCSRAFPCTTSLEFHQTDCCARETGLDLSNSAQRDVNEVKRNDFFSRLNLQDVSNAANNNDSTNGSANKDLADIQTIITMTTSGSILKQLNENSSNSCSKSVNLDRSLDNGEEEAQDDDFAVEFRKMKLRGEFPCRLCTAVFPNLRALKGHNRAHLNSANNGTYRCNMCPHSSIDKAALIRHMRTHNGDRPYECSLCNYAFTTKANCERHLRNRHAKTTRDEVKKSIIYHPSEDPTNNEMNHTLGGNSNKLKSISNSISSTPEMPRCSTPKTEIVTPNPTPTPTPPVVVPPYFPFVPPQSSNESVIESDYEDNDEAEPIQAPLDLSKKKSSNDVDEKVMFPPPQLHPATALPNAAFNLVQPKIDPSALYAQWAILRNNLTSAAGWFPPLNPLFFQHERLRNLCSGGAILPEQHHQVAAAAAAAAFFNLPPDPARQIQNIHEDSLKEPNYHQQKELSNSFQHIKDVAEPPRTVEQASFKPPPHEISPNSHLHLSSNPNSNSNSVKMVIKNGILMPKQKQRRYRTERPFSCEHCSARFTLRSNMERHIKQQHPQFWSQRQRGNIGNLGRKPLSSNAKYCDISIPNYEPSATTTPPNSHHDKSEKLKYALLAQHLNNLRQQQQQQNRNQNQNRNEEEQEQDESELVIDEEDEDAADSKIGIIKEENQDLVPVSRLLDNASQQQFNEYFKRDAEEHEINCAASEEDEEGLVASGSTSDGNVSGTDENRSEPENAMPVKKKSAYSLAPNRVSCPYCSRKFPWTSSLRRHILTHTGQKPFKCSHCPLLFTTKSNCDRHLLRKHGNNATTINNNNNGNGNSNNNEVANNSSNNYLMRNVPERPFKCSNCPSSTFSTYSNLKKHISCKHSTNAQGDDIRAQGYEAGSSEDEKVEHPCAVPTNSPNPDQPFKCHLCEFSCSERQEALEHIRTRHSAEYELLMSKNALELNASIDEQCGGGHEELDDAQSETIRGKFPDYSNRKVVCAFCMRRFWSAEDLRRHMRTHTGERPFSCDICRRRFTLKHSMLRHRKKHSGSGVGQFDNHSDEEALKKTDESDCNEAAGDLISNLLGIRPSFIDKVLTATPDDAAKLLGVKNQNGRGCGGGGVGGVDGVGGVKE